MIVTNKKLLLAYQAGAVEVIRNRDQLNNINVFPVADGGDTGNNLAALMTYILRNTKLEDTVGLTLRSIADAALVGGARGGNSGIIFAGYLNGISIGVQGSGGSLSLKEFEAANKKSCYTGL